MKRIGATFLFVVIGVLALPNVALAECVQPSLSVNKQTIPVEGELIVSGQSFGTSCYENETPPIGEGVLGLPGQDIEIVMTQGDATILVARGNAGNDYDFIVRVKSPVEFTTGAVKITARYIVAGSIEWAELTYVPDLVVIAEDKASETMEPGTVASFGPALSEKIYEQTFNRATYFWFFFSVVLFGMWYRLSRKKLH